MDDLAGRTEAMAGFVEAHVGDRQAVAASIGLGYSNGANILASVIFARPALFDAAVLMHPLIPFDPGAGAGRRHAGADHRRASATRSARRRRRGRSRPGSRRRAQGSTMRLASRAGTRSTGREITAVAQFLR